jgi:low affinity Fe/Cu permease
VSPSQQDAEPRVASGEEPWQEHRDPSEVDARRHWFDEWAELARNVASRGSFFVTLLAATVLWAATYPLFGSVSSWYVVFVLPAEIVTLLLVALLENSNRRSEQALHRKLDSFAAVLADLAAESRSPEVSRHATELRAAIGLQDREATDDA